ERALRHVEARLPRDGHGAGLRGVFVLAVAPFRSGEDPPVRFDPLDDLTDLQRYASASSITASRPNNRLSPFISSGVGSTTAVRAWRRTGRASASVATSK